MPDRLALYPQEARGAAIERAILELEATAWDRTPGETFPSAPETHAASFVLLEGERGCLPRGHPAGAPAPPRAELRGLRPERGRDASPGGADRAWATALCLRAAEWIRAQGADLSLFTWRAGSAPPSTAGRAGSQCPGCLPRGGNAAEAALSAAEIWELGDAGHVPLPARTGTCGGFCPRGHRSGVGERTSFGKKRASALPILWKRGGALDFGEKGGITPPQTRGERSPSPPGARFPRGFPPSGWRRRRTRPARS